MLTIPKNKGFVLSPHAVSAFLPMILKSTTVHSTIIVQKCLIIARVGMPQGQEYRLEGDATALAW